MYVVLGFIGIFCSNALFFLGMKHTSPVNGALIMATNPLVTAILSLYLLHTPVTNRQRTGISFSLLGVILVVTHGSWTIISSLAFSKGDLFIVLGNVCWALYGVLGRRFVRNSSSLQTTAYTMVAGAFYLVLLSPFYPTTLSVSAIPLGAWGGIAFMACFTTVLGYLFWNEGMNAIGASKTSLFFNLVPMVTMIISLFSGMTISWVQLIGAMLVLIGVAVASGIPFGEKRTPTPVNG